MCQLRFCMCQDHMTVAKQGCSPVRSQSSSSRRSAKPKPQNLHLTSALQPLLPPFLSTAPRCWANSLILGIRKHPVPLLNPAPWVPAILQKHPPYCPHQAPMPPAGPASVARLSRDPLSAALLSAALRSIACWITSKLTCWGTVMNPFNHQCQMHLH